MTTPTFDHLPHYSGREIRPHPIRQGRHKKRTASCQSGDNTKYRSAHPHARLQAMKSAVFSGFQLGGCILRGTKADEQVYGLQRRRHNIIVGQVEQASELGSFLGIKQFQVDGWSKIYLPSICKFTVTSQPLHLENYAEIEQFLVYLTNQNTTEVENS